MRAAGGVAADQRAAMNGRQRMETVGEGRQPGFVQPWQRQAQHAADRARAHGGQVGQVHGQRFMPQRTGIDVGKEMPPFQQQVGAGGDLLASRRGKQRAVVAHAQQAGGRRPREIARDQIEFGRHGDSAVRPLRTVVDFNAAATARSGPAGARARLPGDAARRAGPAQRRCCAAAWTSCARTSAASLSSTPLTNLKPSVPPKDLASSTASLMATCTALRRDGSVRSCRSAGCRVRRATARPAGGRRRA